MFGLTRSQTISLIGFLIMVISIPLGFSLLKRSQIFSSKATSTVKQDKPASTDETVTKLREIPPSSPLSDLKKLLESTSSPATQNPSPTPAVSLSFGPTLNLKVNMEGRPKDKNGGKVFVGIAAEQPIAKPTYLLAFTIDMPDSGEYRGLSLAGLTSGATYTAYVKGPSQVDVASTFNMSPTEINLNSGQPLSLPSGDLNEDNTINSADYTIVKNSFGTTPTSTGWTERADFNLDQVINNLDVSLLLKNFGKSGASGTWYSPTPQASGSATLNLSTPQGTGPASRPTGGYWLWVP